MRVLITGGTGYIGSNVASVLADNHVPVVLYDNYENSYGPEVLDALEHLHRQPDAITPVYGDINETLHLENTLKQMGITHVVHCAGKKSVQESEQNPLAYYDTNVRGTLSLLQAMSAANVKNIVFSSSATVYAPSHYALSEDNVCLAVSTYGRTKLVCEQLLKDATKVGFRVISLRYFNPVGAHPSGLLGDRPKANVSNLFPIIGQVLRKEREFLNVYGNKYATPDGTCIRDYVHVQDLARGHFNALEMLDSIFDPFQVINLGTGRGYSVLDIVNTYARVTNQEIPIRFQEPRPGDVPSSVAHVRYAYDVLGWEAKSSLEDMCLDAWLAER